MLSRWGILQSNYIGFNKLSWWGELASVMLEFLKLTTLTVRLFRRLEMILGACAFMQNVSVLTRPIRLEVLKRGSPQQRKKSKELRGQSYICLVQWRLFTCSYARKFTSVVIGTQSKRVTFRFKQKKKKTFQFNWQQKCVHSCTCPKGSSVGH